MIAKRIAWLGLLVVVGCGRQAVEVTGPEDAPTVADSRPAIAEGVLQTGMTMAAATKILERFGATNITGNIGYYRIGMKLSDIGNVRLIFAGDLLSDGISSPSGPDTKTPTELVKPAEGNDGKARIEPSVWDGYFQLWNGNVIRLLTDKQSEKDEFVVTTIEVCDDPVRLSNKEEKWFTADRLDLSALPGPASDHRASHRR